jgi:branched-chain amino acid transport system ATP-binding protein
MSGGTLLMMDDPFLGLAPKDINRLCSTMRHIRRHGFTLFLAGQHVRRILSVATRAYLIEEGRITLSGTGDQLRDHPHLQESLFGIVAEAG